MVFITEETLLSNLQKLQDLKFEIFQHCANLDFHQFGLYTLTLVDQTIDLSDYYRQYKTTLATSEIAELIVKHYHLS